MKKQKLSYDYLKKINVCNEGLKFWLNNFGKKEYTVKQALKKIKKDKIVVDCKDVRWLIKNCKFCQTEEMLKFYKFLKPVHWDVNWLIISCKFCQTDKMLKYYLSLKPDYRDVSWLIRDCKFCQADEMINFYLSLNPAYSDVNYLVENCEYAKNHPFIKKN